MVKRAKSIRIEENLHTQLKQIADQKYGGNMNAAIENGLVQYVANELRGVIKLPLETGTLELAIGTPTVGAYKQDIVRVTKKPGTNIYTRGGPDALVLIFRRPYSEARKDEG